MLQLTKINLSIVRQNSVSILMGVVPESQLGNRYHESILGGYIDIIMEREDV